MPSGAPPRADYPPSQSDTRRGMTPAERKKDDAGSGRQSVTWS
jgi:hypothetical protein